MRHGKTFNHLSRTASHRKSLLANMATSLIIHKRITTTQAKAKALRKYVEPLLTKAKDDSTHSRRVVFSYLKNKESIVELFGPIALKIGDRPGGYTRVMKLMNRKGDNAEMAIIELVDFNEALLAEKGTKVGASKRTRRGKAKVVAPAKEVAAKEVAPATEEAPEEN
ncbi:MAG: 50S ribosomal protein L17 [Bacteroidota bacterium]|nr:50S ribosomal protein L17 [Bacteroidota bacterium]